MTMVDGQILANIAQGTRPIDPQRLILDPSKVLRLLILRPIPTIRPILTRQQTQNDLLVQTTGHRIDLDRKRARHIVMIFQHNVCGSSAVEFEKQSEEWGRGFTSPQS